MKLNGCEPALSAGATAFGRPPIDDPAGWHRVILVDVSLPMARHGTHRSLHAASRPSHRHFESRSGRSGGGAALQHGAKDSSSRARGQLCVPKTLARLSIELMRPMRCLTRHSARRLPSINRRCGDLHGYGRNLSYLNVAAERLTGCLCRALGQPFEAVLRIMDSATGTTVRNPMKEAPFMTRSLATERMYLGST